MNIYTIYDSKAEAYLTPFFTDTDATATRIFTSAATDEQHHFHKYAEDYTLFAIGIWHEKTGAIIPEITPRSIINAISIKTITNTEGI